MQPVYNYTLNTSNAKQVGGGGRIVEKGAYKGVITRAEFVQSEKGTQGIELAFRSDSGQTADYLTLWTVNAQGQELYGRKVVDALRTCFSMRSIAAKQATIKKYDFDARQELPVQTVIFPDLMNKPIGLLLVREEYEKTRGGTDWKMTIVGCYEPTKGLTPKEILEQGPAEQLTKWIAALQDRPLKKAAATAAPASGYANNSARAGDSGFGDMGDDVPF